MTAFIVGYLIVSTLIGIALATGREKAVDRAGDWVRNILVAVAAIVYFGIPLLGALVWLGVLPPVSRWGF